MARALARGRVTPGSTLDLAIRISAGILKDGGGGGDSGGSGPATGNPVIGTDVSTNTAGKGKASRRSRLSYDNKE